MRMISHAFSQDSLNAGSLGEFIHEPDQESFFGKSGTTERFLQLRRQRGHSERLRGLRRWLTAKRLAQKTQGDGEEKPSFLVGAVCGR